MILQKSPIPTFNWSYDSKVRPYVQVILLPQVELILRLNILSHVQIILRLKLFSPGSKGPMAQYYTPRSMILRHKILSPSIMILWLSISPQVQMILRLKILSPYSNDPMATISSPSSINHTILNFFPTYMYKWPYDWQFRSHVQMILITFWSQRSNNSTTQSLLLTFKWFYYSQFSFE